MACDIASMGLSNSRSISLCPTIANVQDLSPPGASPRNFTSVEPRSAQERITPFAFPFVYLHSESLGNVQAWSVSQAVVVVTGVFILRHRVPFWRFCAFTSLAVRHIPRKYHRGLLLPTSECVPHALRRGSSRL